MTAATTKFRTGFLSEMQRYPADGWIAGVCRGIADYFDWKVQWVRVAVIAIALLTVAWPVVIVYAVLWYVMESADLAAPVRPKWSDLPLAAARAASAASTESGTSSMRDIKERFTRLDERLRKLEDAALSKDDDLRREIEKLADDGQSPGR
jgi:phage shock protein C